MKTSILRAFVLPMAAFALASAGAVSTNTSNVSKADVLIPAFIHSPTANDCLKVPDVNCSPGAGPACLSSGVTAYGGSQTSCNQQLHRN
ncbi:DUF6520 family protein [Flavobacterium sp. N3904]|uniref:DUF6520 family protein n=1 Tax=Flavobacterium sp. N3904 TaxID=2986835 RepID=UPI002225361F|nr:DUF6520 family protein [Flavobacterium sp. N3904]